MAGWSRCRPPRSGRRCPAPTSTICWRLPPAASRHCGRCRTRRSPPEVREPVEAMSLILATRNPHKVREVARVLEPAGVSVEPLPEAVELPPEVGETFADNALPKARSAALACGRAAIADDS